MMKTLRDILRTDFLVPHLAENVQHHKNIKIGSKIHQIMHLLANLEFEGPDEPI